MEKKDIANIEDIKVFVNDFYTRIRQDELLGPIFNEKLNDRWPEHLEKMYRFWETVLLEQHTYNGRPFAPHAGLDVEKSHYQRWMLLFTETIDTHFEGEKATEVKWRAEKMALLFHHKTEYFKANPGKVLL